MRYESPTTTKAAVALLSGEKGQAYVLAGGTDLLVRLRMDTIEPDLMVDIKRIPGMSEVTKTASGFKIGAAVSCAALEKNKALVKSNTSIKRASQELDLGFD